MFHADVVAAVRRRASEDDLFHRAGLEKRRYTAFLDYSYGDFIRLVAAGAPLAFPELPVAEAIRKLGQAAYPMTFETHVGRMLFGILGGDVTSVLRHGPKGYSLFASFGTVRAEVLGDRHMRYTYRDFPALLESYQVGVVEGAVMHCKATPRVLVEMHDLANADFDVRW